MSDPANKDPMTLGGEHGFVGKSVVQTNIVFDDELQLKDYHKFVRYLKVRYPTERTIAGRFSKFIREEVMTLPDFEASLKKSASFGKTPNIEKPTTV